jgi:hypothetical protein
MLSLIDQQKELTTWLSTRLRDLDASQETTAYIVNLLASKELMDLLSIGSVVLAYSKAMDFDSKRRLADYVLASEITLRGHLTEPVLCVELAMSCYHQCWKILRPAWPLYKELSIRLPSIIDSAHSALKA